jgi:hypothetical protein
MLEKQQFNTALVISGLQQSSLQAKLSLSAAPFPDSNCAAGEVRPFLSGHCQQREFQKIQARDHEDH